MQCDSCQWRTLLMTFQISCVLLSDDCLFMRLSKKGHSHSVKKVKWPWHKQVFSNWLMGERLLSVTLNIFNCPKRALQFLWNCYAKQLKSPKNQFAILKALPYLIMCSSDGPQSDCGYQAQNWEQNSPPSLHNSTIIPASQSQPLTWRAEMLYPLFRD